MIKNRYSFEDYGKLVLRVTAGGLMLFHGIDKVLNGISPIEGMLISKGMPGFVAWGVYVGEVIAPLFIISGVLTRIFSGIFVFNMCVAVGLVHMGDILSVNKHGGWGIELQALYILLAVSIVLLGPGKIKPLNRLKGFLE